MDQSEPAPKPRKFRFGLRMMMLLVTLIVFLTAWWVHYSIARDASRREEREHFQALLAEREDRLDGIYQAWGGRVPRKAAHAKYIAPLKAEIKTLRQRLRELGD